jgi:hypothetical protein
MRIKIFYVEVLKITIMQKHIQCVVKRANKMYLQVFMIIIIIIIIIILFKVTT